MDRSAAARRVAIGTAIAAAAAAGVAWQDCLLLAVAVVAVHRLVIGRVLDRGDQEWRVAIGSVVAGAGGLVAAAVLTGVAAAALWGWWSPQHPHPGLGLLLLFAIGGLLTAARGHEDAAWTEGRTWLGFGLAVAVAPILADSGYAVAPCLVVLGVAAALASYSWALAHGTAGQLLKAGQRHL